MTARITSDEKVLGSSAVTISEPPTKTPTIATNSHRAAHSALMYCSPGVMARGASTTCIRYRPGATAAGRSAIARSSSIVSQ